MLVARQFTLLLALAPPLVLACDAQEDDDDDYSDLVAEVSADECASGRKWIGGDEESSLMKPGGDCIGCHTREGEGPRYVVAGTVFANLDAADDCFGLAGVKVEILDANADAWQLTSNDAGNFWIKADDGPVALPFTAKITVEGTEIPMVTPQSTGSCATCHTQSGANAALGRIYVP